MENDLDIKKLLFDYSKKTTPLLRRYLESKTSDAKKIGAINVEMLQKFLKLVEKGKKVRGLLVVLGYQIAGGKDLEAIYEASTFMEIMHCGGLIHDDIMDNDDYRRGVPTIHKQFEKYGRHNGESLAIMAGDMALYLSWDKLLNSNFSAEALIAAGKIYSRYALNTVYGQTLDALNNQDSKADQSSILNIFRYKTAEYTGVLPLLVGAALSGVSDRKKIKKLSEYGLALGWAFQIQDDLLGLFGSAEKTGKPVGSDLREGKMTILIHYILKNGNKQQKEYLVKILGNKNLEQKDIEEAQDFFKKAGAYQYVLDLGWDYVARGKAAIPFFTKDENLKLTLGSLISFVMNRIA